MLLIRTAHFFTRSDNLSALAHTHTHSKFTTCVRLDARTVDGLLSRDAMRRRGLCCRPVSVRPNVRTFVYCIQTANRYRQTFYGMIVIPSWFLEAVYGVTQFQTEALSRGVKNLRKWGNCDFRPKSPFISETLRNETGVMVAMER